MSDTDPEVIPKTRQNQKRRTTATINPFFNRLVIINAVICVVCFVGGAVLAIYAAQPMTDAQRQFATFCDYGFKMTAGAFIGLLGGRAASPDPK